MRRLRELLRNQEGQAATEYALLVSLIALMAMGFNVLFLKGVVATFDGIFFMTSLPFP